MGITLVHGALRQFCMLNWARQFSLDTVRRRCPKARKRTSTGAGNLAIEVMHIHQNGIHGCMAGRKAPSFWTDGENKSGRKGGKNERRGKVHLLCWTMVGGLLEASSQEIPALGLQSKEERWGRHWDALEQPLTCDQIGGDGAKALLGRDAIEVEYVSVRRYQVADPDGAVGSIRRQGL